MTGSWGKEEVVDMMGGLDPASHILVEPYPVAPLPALEHKAPGDTTPF
jgi:hypothetical protein